jgi:MvaI/BcnI restriction endonuclease family
MNSLKSLVAFYADHGVEKIYFKQLSPNDNSKNQVYFGPDFSALSLFPIGEITPDPAGKKPIFKASLDFHWIGDDGSLILAPAAQIILYPQYPEVRFSGFLQGAQKAHIEGPRSLMTTREEGRLLSLGATRDGKVIGCVFSATTAVASEFREIANRLTKPSEIFFELLVSTFLGSARDPRILLLNELGRIHRLDWIDSKRLDATGTILSCTAPQCGGYTLEAELGIKPNGRAEPDFHGWEVKQHGSSVITLMTPEPTGGYYVEEGVEKFVRTYGYADKNGKENRMNFGGVHLCDKKHNTTNLTLTIQGYDPQSHKITDASGGLSLVEDNGKSAAFWSFASVLKHWNKKHNNAVYVPSEHRKEPVNQYRYGNPVLLAEGTDALMLLNGLQTGAVYYDPAIKLENMNTESPTNKRRSQFRVKLKDIKGLYKTVTDVDTTTYCT